jgi:hypothetical protein
VTHPRAVVDRGLRFRHVTKFHREERRKYVNSAEVEVVLRLAEQKLKAGSSLMILTPVSKKEIILLTRTH